MCALAVVVAAIGASAASGAARLQPVGDQAAPPGRHAFAAADVTVAPTAIVSGAPGQDVRVAVTPRRAFAAGDRLAVRLRRIARPPSPSAGRAVTALSVATAVDGSPPVAGRPTILRLASLSPPPGLYDLDVLVRGADGRETALGSAPVLVRGQHRLPARPPAGVLPGARPTPHAQALVGDEVDHDLNGQAGEQEETYVAVQPNAPRRAIAAVNPDVGTNPQAWISDNFLRPGTAVAATLPDTSRLPAAQGGGTAALPLCCDPSLAADTLGNLWYAVLSSDPAALPDNDPLSHIVVNRVAAGSTSFQAANTALPKFSAGLQDKLMMTIDDWPASPRFGTLYIVWVENPGQNIVISQCTTRPGGASDPGNCDDPNHWSGPARITDLAGNYSYPSVAAAPNGDVYVSWLDFSDPPAGNRISIDRCAAGAACDNAGGWGPDALVRALDASGGTAAPFFCPLISAPQGRVGPLQYVEVGPDGRVYVALSDLRANGTTKCTAAATDQTYDVLLARGATPGAFPGPDTTKRLSDDAPNATNDHFYPALAVDPSTGEVTVSFYSTKADASRSATLQYAVTSTDGAATFGALTQLTSAPSNFSGAATTPNDYGDYEGADAAGGQFFPVWTDNRGGNGDLFVRSAPVDTTAPDTSLDSGPSGTVATPTPQFTFSSGDPRKADVSFECSVDAGAFTACASPSTSPAQADGAHSFAVRARDTSGNIDASPATRDFGVDTTPPDTVLAGGPTGLVRTRALRFGFSATEPGSRFECRTDGTPFVACSPPFTTAALRDGDHAFEVRAQDAVGNVDPTPAARTLKVDATAPSLRLRIARNQRTLRRRAILVRVVCGERCRVTATGTIATGRGAIRLRTRRVRTLRRAAAGILSLPLSTTARGRLGRAIGGRRGAVARITVRATDAAGNTRRATRRVRLRG